MPVEQQTIQPNISAIKISSIRLTVFFVGFSAMAVSGWYLVEGMLHFAGDDTSKYIFIAAGIIFQITESICFIGAAALTAKSFYWRTALFALGSILFVFSIIVMTLAQKATLQAGENQADALNIQIDAIQSQISSLDSMISSYQLNAEKQSNSIYANSRELGQDSLNRATELEDKKLKLSEKLYKLNIGRRQTSVGFFTQIEKITGFPALQTEFYFLISRSLLLELCGIVLMAFAAHLKLSTAAKPQTAAAPATSKPHPAPSKPVPAQQSVQHIPDKSVESGEHWATTHIRLLKQTNKNSDSS